MRFLQTLFFAAVVGGAASAQPMWRPAPNGPIVSLDVLKSFEECLTLDQGTASVGPSAWQSAQIASVRVPVTAAVLLTGDLPMAYFEHTVTPDDAPILRPVPAFGVGNPYVGVEVTARPGLAVEGGVRLPLSSRGNNGIGTNARFAGLGALFEATEAYAERTASASLGVRFEPALSSTVRLRLRAVPTVRSFPSSEQVGGQIQDTREMALAMQYGAQVVGLVGPVDVAGGVVGRIEGPGGTDFDPALLTLGASIGALPVRPGVLVRVPLRDYLYDTDAVVGVSLDVPLR